MSEALQQRFAQALGLHQAGHLAAAEGLYRAILNESPNHAEALGFLGMLYSQAGQPERGIPLLEKAARLNGRNAMGFLFLGDALRAAGRHEDALQAYRKAIKIKPDLADAHANLGALLLEAGRAAEALQALERAHRIAPKSVATLVNLGNAYHQRGLLDRALESYRQALALDGGLVQAHVNLGNVLLDQENADGAIESYLNALNIAPDLPQARFNLGNALKQKGDLNGAIAAFEAILQGAPQHAEAHNNLGACLRATGHLEQALKHFEAAIALNPAYAEACYNAALTLEQLGRDEAALAQYEQAVEQSPDFVDALYNLANLELKLHHAQRALELLQKVIALRPEYADAHNNLGVALYELGRFAEAVACYERALALKPDYAEAFNNRGVVALGLNDPASAKTLYGEAIRLNPAYPEAHHGMGLACFRSGDLDRGIAAFQRAIALRPDYAEAHFTLASTLLSCARFEAGWREYEWRVAHKVGLDYLRDPRKPEEILPRPSHLMPLAFEGKRFLVITDQGIGDELFFLRFAPELKRRGAWIGYLPTQKTVPLARRITALDAVLDINAVPPDWDYVLAVGELPLILEMKSIADIPPPIPLQPLAARVAEMRGLLAQLGRGPFLALTWRGGMERLPGTRATLFKEAPIDRLAQAVSAWPGEILVVQRNPQAGEIAMLSDLLGRKVHDLSALNDDLDGMLALLSLVDEYVGVSNTNMHLMASMGRTARVLVPYPPEWRWMAEGEGSPWFPGFVLYREDNLLAWAAALDGLRRDLEKVG